MELFRVIRLCTLLLGSLILTACVSSGPRYRTVCQDPPDLSQRRVLVVPESTSSSWYGGSDTNDRAIMHHAEAALQARFSDAVVIGGLPGKTSQPDIRALVSKTAGRPANNSFVAWQSTWNISVKVRLIDERTGTILAWGEGSAVYDGGDGVYGRSTYRTIEGALRHAVYEAVSGLCHSPLRAISIR